MTPKFFHVAFFYSGLIFQLYSNCFYGNEVLVLVSPRFAALCAYRLLFIFLRAVRSIMVCTFCVLSERRHC